MQLFVMSNHCTSKAHCETCRKLEDGRTWRRNLTKFFLLPDNNIDFACPHGKEWDGRKPTQPMRAPASPLVAAATPTSLAVPAAEENCSPCERRRREAAAAKK
jgi:hypothetical protein